MSDVKNEVFNIYKIFRSHFVLVFARYCLKYTDREVKRDCKHWRYFEQKMFWKQAYKCELTAAVHVPHQYDSFNRQKSRTIQIIQSINTFRKNEHIVKQTF